MSRYYALFITDIEAQIENKMEMKARLLALKCCEKLNITMQQLQSKIKMQALVFYKAAVAIKLINSGINSKIAGKMVARDHASVSHYKKNLGRDKEVIEYLEIIKDVK